MTRKRGPAPLSYRLPAGILLAGTLILGGSGCSKETKEAASAGPAQELVERLNKAGLETGSFEQAAAEPYAAQRCLRGRVEQLDVLICGYADEASAKAAEPKLQHFIGTAVTGLIRQRGPAAIAVADRDKKDLQGKAINKVSQAIQGS